MTTISSLRLCLALLTAAALHGQALVEFGLAAGKSAPPMEGTRKSAGRILGTVSNTLEKSGGISPSSPVDPEGALPVVSSGNQDKKDAAKPASQEPISDASAISVGLERAELLARFGKPSIKLTGADGSALVETCWYKTASGTATVILRDGKVTSVEGPRR